jgi:hypothetical protein
MHEQLPEHLYRVAICDAATVMKLPFVPLGNHSNPRHFGEPHCQNEVIWTAINYCQNIMTRLARLSKRVGLELRGEENRMFIVETFGDSERGN